MLVSVKHNNGKMSDNQSKMLRLIRACTGLSARDFGKPLQRGRGAIEQAEKSGVSEKTIESLVGKALAQYASEIPDFLAAEANKLLNRRDEPVARADKPQASMFRSIEVRAINRLGQEEVKSNAVSDCPSDRAFAITAGDTALEPEIRKGSLIVLDPDAHLTEGTLVGVSLNHGGILVRRYSLIPGERPKVLLTSSRPAEYHELTLDPKTELQWIFPVYSVTTRCD
jgi:hypothetical protein